MENYKKEMRQLGLRDDNYELFKKWYSKNYGRKIHENLDEFYSFYKESEGLLLEQVKKEVRDWNEYCKNLAAETEIIEEFLAQEANEYFSGLNEYGYIYETRNIAIGDSSMFFSQDGDSYYLDQNPHIFYIEDILWGDSYLDVKKREIGNRFMINVTKVIEDKINESTVSGKLPTFKESVKVVFDDVYIKSMTDAYGCAVVFRMGVKVF